MTDSTVKTCVMLLILSLSLACAVSGEIVIVRTERPSRTCILPRTLDVTIRRTWEEGDDDVYMHLKINDVIKVPHSVVLMTDDVETGRTKYQHKEIPQENVAYHSFEHEACISVHCSLGKDTATPFYVLEGTFVHNGVNRKLSKKNDDVVFERHYVTAAYVLEEVANLSGPQTYDYILLEDGDEGIPAGFRPGNDQGMDSGHQERVKKRSVTKYYLDILPVVDYHLYKRWLIRYNGSPPQAIKAITSYITNVFTSMSLRFNTLKLSGNVVLDIRMLTPFISTSEGTSKFTEDNKSEKRGVIFVNMRNQIRDFKEWVSTNTDLPVNDHVMLFTGYGWYFTEIGGLRTRVKGMAWLRTFCFSQGRSLSIVQDEMGYQCETVAAHELAHSLGAVHDGIDNTCPIDDRHVMATKQLQGPNLSNMLGRFSFSNCSSAEISSQIQLLQSTPYLSTCLLKAQGADLPAKPTTSYDIRHLCPVMYGRDSTFCYSTNSFPGNKDFVCTSVMCSRNNRYCYSLIPPSGTCCGRGKYCVQGVCSPAPGGMCANYVSPVD